MNLNNSENSYIYTYVLQLTEYQYALSGSVLQRCRRNSPGTVDNGTFSRRTYYCNLMLSCCCPTASVVDYLHGEIYTMEISSTDNRLVAFWNIFSW
jgi:hypothetical protein